MEPVCRLGESDFKPKSVARKDGGASYLTLFFQCSAALVS